LTPSKAPFRFHDLRSECFWVFRLALHVTLVVKLVAHSHTNCLTIGTGWVQVIHMSGRSEQTAIIPSENALCFHRYCGASVFPFHPCLQAFQGCFHFCLSTCYDSIPTLATSLARIPNPLAGIASGYTRKGLPSSDENSIPSSCLNCDSVMLIACDLESPASLKDEVGIVRHKVIRGL
jgi:hypothetical protein